MRKGIIIKGVTPHNATTFLGAHILHFFVSFKLHVTLYYWFLIEMVFSCSLLKKHPYSVDLKELIVEDFFFNIIYSGHFLLVWPGLLHFEHFLTALEPLAGCWKLQLACCRTSFSAPEETKILRQANFIWSFVNYKLMMCRFLVLTEFWLYPYFACTCANTLSSPPQNNFIGIYSIIEM